MSLPALTFLCYLTPRHFFSHAMGHDLHQKAQRSLLFFLAKLPLLPFLAHLFLFFFSFELPL